MLIINQTPDNWLEITLNRPAKANAITTDMFAGMSAAMSTTKCSGLVIKANGKHFSAGADLKEMAACSLELSSAQKYAKTIEDFFSILKSLDCPIIVYCQGAAFGAGFGICASADIVVADKNSRFACPEIKSNIAPCIIAPIIIKKIGLSRAKKMFITGNSIDTNTAQDLGVVDFVGHNQQPNEIFPNLQSARNIKAMLSNKKFSSVDLAEFMLDSLTVS